MLWQRVKDAKVVLIIINHGANFEIGQLFVVQIPIELIIITSQVQGDLIMVYNTGRSLGTSTTFLLIVLLGYECDFVVVIIEHAIEPLDFCNQALCIVRLRAICSHLCCRVLLAFIVGLLILLLELLVVDELCSILS